MSGVSRLQRTVTMGTLVNYSTEKGVALLTLTDPPVNAYTHEMFKELDSCILEARFDNDVHVMVITGHGDKYFCAGANINMLKEADETFKYYFCLHANETLLRLENTPKLTVAAINGHCVGGGLEVALACDLIVASASAKIGSVEAAIGLNPLMGGIQRVTERAGAARAKEMALLARRYDARTLERWNIINRVVPDEHLAEWGGGDGERPLGVQDPREDREDA